MKEHLPKSVEAAQEALEVLDGSKRIVTLLQNLSGTPQIDSVVDELNHFLKESPALIDVYLDELPNMKDLLKQEKDKKKIHDQRRGLIQRGIDVLRDQVIKPFVEKKGSFWKTPAGHVLQVNAKVNTKDGDLVVIKERSIEKDGVEDKNPSVNPDFKRCHLTISFPARQTETELEFFRGVVKEHQQVARLGLRISKVEVEMTSDNKATALTALRDGHNLAWRVIVETPPKKSVLSKGDSVEVLSWKDDGDVVVKVADDVAELLKEGTFTIEEWCHLENPKILSIHMNADEQYFDQGME
jgi:hypothetical protein